MPARIVHVPGPPSPCGTGSSRLTDHPYGGFIKLDGSPVGMFLDGACPEAPGVYAYMPVRAIGHYTMSVAVRAGKTPRCTWTHGSRSASLDVLAVPRYGILSIGNVAVTDARDATTTSPHGRL